MLTLVCLTACASGIDESTAAPEATIAVADTRLGLAGRLNTRLERLGWNLTAYQTGREAGLETPPPPDLATRARYRLVLRAAEIGTCAGNLDTAYVYDIRLIDNRDGRVLVDRSGRGCETDIADRFQARLRQIGLLPPGADGE
ncbi:hypothetical protein [Salinisphaera sp. PC39]|uniref:hypothetical protein n=1 Tax=Salinisphaera sp. PC39 TaxID=1304156 RepID=UPI00333FAF24